MGQKKVELFVLKKWSNLIVFYSDRGNVIWWILENINVVYSGCRIYRLFVIVTYNETSSLPHIFGLGVAAALGYEPPWKPHDY